MCAQVGASSDAIAAFLSGLVGQYEAGAAIEELRQQAAEVRHSLSNDCVASSHSAAGPTPMQPASRHSATCHVRCRGVVATGTRGEVTRCMRLVRGAHQAGSARPHRTARTHWSSTGGSATHPRLRRSGGVARRRGLVRHNRHRRATRWRDRSELAAPSGASAGRW